MGLRDVFRAILRRDREFKTNYSVAAETYMRTGDRVHAIDEKHVAAAAANLEAAYVMSEDIPHDALVALTMTRTELHSFVCYMRQLDSSYRQQGEFIDRHIKPVLPSLPDGHAHEFKTIEEAAPVSAELYAQLTGKSAGDPSLRGGGEFIEKSAGRISLAEAERRTGEPS